MRAVTAAVAGALAAASIVGGIGAAVGPDATLYACVHNKAQTIKMTTASKACLSGYTKISWNTQGPKGDTGAQGPQGPQGPQGNAAPTSTNYSAQSSCSTSPCYTVAVYCNAGDTATGGGLKGFGPYSPTVTKSAPILDQSGNAVGWEGADIYLNPFTVTVLCIHTA
jgi:hypothetical protein